MEIRHADLQIEVEDAEDGGVLLTIIDSARLSLSLPRKTATGATGARQGPGSFAFRGRGRSLGFRPWRGSWGRTGPTGSIRVSARVPAPVPV